MEGALPEEDALTTAEQGLDVFSSHQDDFAAATGALIVRISVQLDGTVAEVAIIFDTLVIRPSTGVADAAQARAFIQHAAVDAFQSLTFAAASGVTTVTLPLIFE